MKLDLRSLQRRNLLINIDIFYHRVSFNVPLTNVINGDLTVSGSRELILSRRQMKSHHLLILTAGEASQHFHKRILKWPRLSVCVDAGELRRVACVCKTFLCDLFATPTRFIFERQSVLSRTSLARNVSFFCNRKLAKPHQRANTQISTSVRSCPPSKEKKTWNPRL